MIKLLIVDDHALVRSGIIRLVENHAAMHVIGECQSGEEAYDFLFKKTVDLIVMDISMPGMGGIEATAKIKKRYPKVRILILSMHDNPMIIKKAIEAGADGYILKNDLSDNLLVAIDSIHRGDKFSSNSVEQSLKEDRDTSDVIDKLTPRELEIFRLLAQGYDVDFIAGNLNMSYKTAANYQTAVKKKLNIKTPVELLNLAKKKDLI